MFESNSEFVIRADMPGLKKDDLNVEVTDDELTISGERKDEREEHKREFYRSERSYGRFERRIALPEGINADDVSCTFANGILEIRMKAPEQQTKCRPHVDILDKGSTDKPEKAA
jgi:HSP20 family protein